MMSNSSAMKFLTGSLGTNHGKLGRRDDEELSLLKQVETDEIFDDQPLQVASTAMDFCDPESPGAYQQKTVMNSEPDYLCVVNPRQASVDSGNGLSNSPTSVESVGFSYSNSGVSSTDNKTAEKKQETMRIDDECTVVSRETSEIESECTTRNIPPIKPQQQSGGYAFIPTSRVSTNSEEPGTSASNFSAIPSEKESVVGVGVHERIEGSGFPWGTTSVRHGSQSVFTVTTPAATGSMNNRGSEPPCPEVHANRRGNARRTLAEELIKVQIVVFSTPEPMSLVCHVPTLAISDQSELVCESSQCDPETVLFDAVRQCSIAPLYLPMFGIWNTKEKNWIILSEPLEVKQQQLELRVRFTVKAVHDQINACRIEEIDSGEQMYPVMSNDVLRYLFHQRRHNFLKLYPIKFERNYWLRYIFPNWSEGERNLQGDEVLVPAVFDLFYQKAQIERKIQLEDPIKLLPNSTKESFKSAGFFNFLNKHIIRKRFQQILQLFNGLEMNKPPEFFCQKFITYVETLEHSFATEIFPLAADIGAVSVNGDNGVVIAVENDKLRDVMEEEFAIEEGERMRLETVDDVSILRLDFARIAETTIVARDDDCQVYMSDILGHQFTLKFPTLISSQRFVECVNGYFSILVDPYCSLSQQTLMSSAIEGHGKVHGPVTSQYIFHKLTKHPSNHACIYRKRQSAIGEYEVAIKIPKTRGVFTIQRLPITRDSGYRLRVDALAEVQSSVTSIDDVIATIDCNSNKNLFDNAVGKALKNLIAPCRRDKVSLLVRRAGDAKEEDPEEMKFPHIPEKDMGLVAGAFNADCRLTLIREYIGGRHSSGFDKKFVCQTILLVENRSMQQQQTEAFEASLSMLFQARHHCHVVRQLGVTVSNPWKVLEHSEWGSVTDYFATRASSGRRGADDQGAITGYWLLHLFYQFAHVLNYLEYKNLPHGNIRGENLLLFRVSPTPFIKLTHPGMRLTDKKQGKELPLLPLPWLASEYCNLPHVKTSAGTSQATIAADKWAFATTICEITKAAETGSSLDISCPASATFFQGTRNDTWERKWKQIVTKLTEMYCTGDISTLPNWLDYPKHCCPQPQSTESVAETLRRCWSLNPEHRPACRDLLQIFALLLRHDVGQGTVFMGWPISLADDESTASISKNIPMYRDTELERVKSLGKGSFGIVELCRHKNTGVLYAVKDIRTSNPAAVINFFKEVLAMFPVKHKNVVEIKALTVPTLRIVMDHVELGSLFNVLKKSEPKDYPRFDPSHLTSLSRDIAKGLRQLHRLKIVHRDLALRNILVKEIAKGTYIAMVSDFGFARLTDKEPMYKDYSEKKEFPTRWYPPESLKPSDGGPTVFSFKSDIWSYGVTAWEIFEPDSINLLRSTLSKYSSELYSQLEHGVRLPRPRLMPENVYHIVEKCWKFNEEDRIDLDDIVRVLRHNV